MISAALFMFIIRYKYSYFRNCFLRGIKQAAYNKSGHYNQFVAMTLTVYSHKHN